MNTQPQDNMGGNVQGNAGQEDYVDKGRHFQPYFRAGGNAHRLDMAEKKFGQGKVDPNKQRGMNEKVTDGARGMFEKVTGKNIPDKFSN
ncbi:hypothetical protein MMC19_004131 [Ptychographa xylographoides]|nr:hypothetical protein [Ptychographa xylographoides]